MAIYKPYPKYKNSNIPWLGEIPEHWEITKLKYLITLQKGKVPKEFSNKENNLPYLSMEYLRGKLTIPSYVLPQENLIEVENDELLILWDGANAGEVMKSKKGVLSSTMAVIRINENYFDERFFFHFLKWLEKELKTFANGTTIPHLDSSVLIDNHYCIPLFAEQTTIARFLDYKLAKINRFIHKKKQLIKLLNEQKAAIINQAVTKGLDPNVKMKDSGIEWLGEIPEHWDVSKIKWLTPVKRGASPRPIDDPIYFDEDGEFGWVRIADVTASERYLENTTQKLSELGSSLSVKQFPGDLFLSIAGSVGKPIITKIKCCIHDGFVWFPLLQINKEFIYYIFTAGRCYLGLGKMGTQLNLNTDSVGGITIPLPPTNEIDDIVEFLDLETATINTTITKIEKEIALVEEYKTALIAEAVTGKIDVRGYEVPEISEEETYEDLEEEISMAAEDAAEYENESDL